MKRAWGWVVSFGLLSQACTAPESRQPALGHVATTRGGAVVLSRDERVAVVTNRSAGVVTVFSLDPQAPAERSVLGQTQLDIGPASEPWAAVIGGDDDTAYVIARSAQAVLRVVDLHRHPHLSESLSDAAKTGSEPTAIAITPSGARLFVANWAEGTLSVITTADFRHRWAKVDFNEALANSGFLGNVAPRSALAHPRALAMTDDGDADDTDETLYATEFFAEPIPGVDPASDPLAIDRSRQGLVYPMSVATGQLGEPITLAPLGDTGFYDAPNAQKPSSERRPTGCFPNQLYAALSAGTRLFVSGMCASPAGPLGVQIRDGVTYEENYKTLLHPALFVIDTAHNRELVDQHLVFTRELEQSYSAEGALDARMPLIPNDLALADATLYVTAFGADAVFPVDVGQPPPFPIGTPGRRFIALGGGDVEAGILPIGIAVSKDGSRAFVLNDNTQNLSVIELLGRRIVRVEPAANQVPHAAATLASPENEGRKFFARGLGAWSYEGQAWSSCEGCHPDGLSDGLTWFFSRGPRRTLSTAGTYDGSGRRRVLLWTANIDEIHDIEVIVRNVEGGAGGIVWNYSDDLGARIIYDGTYNANTSPAGSKPSSSLHNGLNGSLAELVDAKLPVCETMSSACDKSSERAWDTIDAYIRSVRTPRAPTDLVEEEVAAGKLAFRAGRCAACHSGPAWTLSNVFYTPGPESNGALPSSPPAAAGSDELAALLGRLRTIRYSVPPELRGLNTPGATGEAPLRRWNPPDADPIDMIYAGGRAQEDQINCVLRSVGTFPAQDAGPNTRGVAAPGALPVPEVRQDMTTLAVGQTGFNISSLLGLAVGAPYFHAGNARTLEEAFDEAFAAHHRALGDFLSDAATRPERIRELVAYLLSIDDQTPTEAPPPDLGFNPDLCTLP